MKKLVFGAAALTLTGTALANDSDWAQLDQDIQALSASFQGMEGTGMNLGGRIRAAYENSGDIIGGGGNDLGGFSIYNARLYAHGTTAHDIMYRLEVDFARNGLLDAYLDIPAASEITVRVGQFRASVTRENMIDSGDLFFFDRSIPAQLFAGRNQGIAAHGNFDAFEWAVTIQNGGDAQGDELFYALRGEIDLMGEGGVGDVEGAFGTSDEMDATVGVAYFDDGATDDANGFIVDGAISTNQFSASAIILSAGDGAITSNFDTNERTFGLFGPVAIADATAFSVGGTFKLTDSNADYGAWEVGARFQSLDDANDTTVLDVGLNHYVSGNHDMKYIIGFTSVDADGGFDGTLIRVGVQSRF